MSDPELRAAEAFATELFERRPQARIAWFLMLSYLYYECDLSLVSDGFFDNMCLVLKQDFKALEHPHKHLITRSMLNASSGHSLAGKFPGKVVSAATALVAKFQPGRVVRYVPPIPSPPTPVLKLTQSIPRRKKRDDPFSLF